MLAKYLVNEQVILRHEWIQATSVSCLTNTMLQLNYKKIYSVIYKISSNPK